MTELLHCIMYLGRSVNIHTSSLPMNCCHLDR